MRADPPSLPRPSRRHPPRPGELARRIRRVLLAPAGRLVVAAAVALAAGAVVHRSAGAAEEARARWGEPVAVVVVTRAVPAGAEVGPGDVAADTRPAAVVPEGAAVDLDAVVGRTASATLAAGEVVVAARVGADGTSGAAALLPPGGRGVAVAAGPGTPVLAVGDRVDVLATVDVLDTGTGHAGEVAPAPTVRVAEAVPVVALADDGTATLGVAEADVERVAFAAARGTVTLALVGAG